MPFKSIPLIFNEEIYQKWISYFIKYNASEEIAEYLCRTEWFKLDVIDKTTLPKCRNKIILFLRLADEQFVHCNSCLSFTTNLTNIS